MCIIAVKPKNAEMFSDEELKNMFKNNSDGAGFVYNDGTHTYMKKGYFTEKSFLKALHKIDFTGKDLLIHCRISTSGKVDCANCHPFYVKNDIFFAHNGVLSDYTDYKSDKNDTRLFCEKVLKNIDSNRIFNDKTVQLLLEELIGSSNRLAFINSEGFKLIGDFTKDNNRYYSNSSYKTSYAYRYSPHYNWYDDYAYDNYYSKYYSNYPLTKKETTGKTLEDVSDSIFYNGFGIFDNKKDYNKFIQEYDIKPVVSEEDDPDIYYKDKYDNYYNCDEDSLTIELM